MTACFKLMRALQPQGPQPENSSLCDPCVYFSRNLDPAKFDIENASALKKGCSLDFFPGDDGCREMRTNNCSARKK